MNNNVGEMKNNFCSLKKEEKMHFLIKKRGKTFVVI